MMKGWTRRLGRSKSSSDKSRKQSESSTSSAPSDIRPEALDVNNTTVSSRREKASKSESKGSSSRNSGTPALNIVTPQTVSAPQMATPVAPDRAAVHDDALRPALGSGSPPLGRLMAQQLGQMDGIQTPTRHNSSMLEISQERQLEQLPAFEEVPPKEHYSLFLQKVEQCCVVFNFSDPGSDMMGKEIKRITLCELIEYISTTEIFINDQMYREVIRMFSKNVIRSIPPPKNPFGDIFDPDDDEPVNVDAWPHMSLVYEFFLRFVDAPDFNVTTAKQYIDQNFVLSLLELFDSEDPRERDYLKTVLHRIYGKFLTLRPFIRRSVNNVFTQFIYETGRFNGIAELLEIYGSIINGFAIPLKEEHKIFLKRVLIPLHTARSLGLYHSHLTYCVVQFLEKDPTLTEEVIHGLLRYWPKTSSPKEILFLLELEDIFDTMEPSEFVKVEVPLFEQLARCISSPHGQVAERALYNWTHEYFSTLVAENSETILPIIFGSLRENAGHWNRNIHGMVFNASKMFLETNPQLYDRCAAEYRERKRFERERGTVLKQKWDVIERMAAQRVKERKQPATEEGTDAKAHRATLADYQGENYVSPVAVTQSQPATPSQTQTAAPTRNPLLPQRSGLSGPSQTSVTSDEGEFEDAPSPASPTLLSCPPSPEEEHTPIHD